MSTHIENYNYIDGSIIPKPHLHPIMYLLIDIGMRINVDKLRNTAEKLRKLIR